MDKIGKSLNLLLTLILILASLIILAVVWPPAKNALCAAFSRNLPKFCQGGAYVPNAVNAYTVYQSLSSVPPQALMAKWSGHVCVDSTTKRPLGEITSLLSFVETSIGWLGNTFRSEDWRICNFYRVPIYVGLAGIRVSETSKGVFDIVLPPPTLGSPAPTGEWEVSASGRILSESDARRSEILGRSLLALSQEASSQAKQSMEVRSQVVCQAARQVAAVLSSFQNVRYNIRWGDPYIHCQ